MERDAIDALNEDADEGRVGLREDAGVLFGDSGIDCVDGEGDAGASPGTAEGFFFFLDFFFFFLAAVAAISSSSSTSSTVAFWLLAAAGEAAERVVHEIVNTRALLDITHT